ncbi:hypothetical protein WN944_007584 [Citrus x changshan-huyou]|uniref:Uncharacterized protein n=1 Tax=Citrus x changshan-huyou TaxID=2935761 RepID=A0AAP0QV18_9ROSI
MNQPDPITIHHLALNQDHGCFATGTETGFRVYLSDPYKPIMRRDFDRNPRGGTQLVSMLFRSNIICLVNSGPHQSNKVMIWDDHENRYLGELSFRSEVKNVRLRRDRIVVVLNQKVYVYNFTDLKLVDQIETVVNPTGLCDVSQNAGPMVMACPGLLKGQVRVEDYGTKKSKYITAHASRIASIAMTLDGRFVATASSKGTLIRVFNTMDGSLLQEMRRGAERAEIYSLAFSSNAQWLAASSDKGTVHVFGLKVDSGSPGTGKLHSAPEPNLSSKNSSANSSFRFIRGVLPKYFSSKWSMAQFRLPENVQYLVGFGRQNNTIVIVGLDGSYYKCEFDPMKGGEMHQLEHYKFLKPEEPF